MNASTAPDSHLQRLGAAAAAELRKTVRTALTDVFGNFMQKLPAAVGEEVGKASNPTDRQTLTDLSRNIGSQAAAWIESFARQVDQHMIGGIADALAEEAGVPAGADDSVALAGVELRAEERYQKLVTELDARLNRIGLMMYVPIYSKALAPASLCRSLQETAESMHWPPRYRRMLLEKFDQLVVPQLERVYRVLITALTRIGAEAVKASGESLRKTGSRRVLKMPPKGPQPMQAPTNSREVDGASLGMLESMAIKSDGEGYTDGLLASDLLALNDGKPLPGVVEDQSWVPIQRVSLAGHFLNVVISDAMVPDDLKPQHETVRFPLMKSALTDDSLFTSKTHPLGTLINELLLKSATSRLTGNPETRRMAELLQQVLVQFNLAPEFVRQAIRTTAPIQETQIQRFFELQKQQAQQRRDFVIAEAKRIVVKKLEEMTFARNIPAPGLRFLNTAWGPLLTKRLLQHGAASPLWTQALDQMDKLLDLLEARQPGTAPTAEWKDLLNHMGNALVTEGMARAKVTEALQALEASRHTQVAEAI
ncbi:MAG: DUF1631 family protein [Gammaproteobacteria bacterium]